MKCIIGIFEKIKKEAARITDFYNTNDPSAIAKYLGLIIIKSDLGSVQGFLQYYKSHYIVHLNENIEDNKKIDRILAHELGHYFLHKHLNIFKLNLSTLAFSGKIEKEADLFASELLLPDKLLKEEAIYIENMNVQELAIYFNIELELLDLKYSQSKVSYFF